MSTLLVLNSGSSSVKYELFDTSGMNSIASGAVERIGEPLGRQTCVVHSGDGESVERVTELEIGDHRAGLRHLFETLSATGVVRDPRELGGIGHRVAHGGERFVEPTLLDELICHISSLASVYHKPPSAFVEGRGGLTRKFLPARYLCFTYLCI